MKKGKRGNEQSLKIIGNKGPKKWINPMAGQNSKQKKKFTSRNGKEEEGHSELPVRSSAKPKKSQFKVETTATIHKLEKHKFFFKKKEDKKHQQQRSVINK